MKTAEELWNDNFLNQYEDGSSINNTELYKSCFKEALFEHDKEIISKIDEMIKNNPMVDDSELNGYDRALTELKQWIQGEIK